MLELVPAIDLMQGRLVRLRQGKQEHASHYGLDPVMVAREYENVGAPRIHLIDLDAALGQGSNLPLIKTILGSLTIPSQVGGGLRTKAQIDEVFQAGATQVILGSLIYTNPPLAQSFLKEYGPDRIIAAVDYTHDIVTTHGWTYDTRLHVDEAVESLYREGFKWLFATNAQRDGTLQGPDLETLQRIAQNRHLQIIAAGGIGSLAHIRSVASTGVARLIIGKALYEKQFTLEEALETLRR